MDLTPERKKIIDNLPYLRLLWKWRTAPIGDPWMQGEAGAYWAQRMREVRPADCNEQRAFDP